MKNTTRAALLLAVLSAASLLAQSAPPAIHAPAGGERETISSIYIPPLTAAPFSATVVLESTKTLEDGGTITLANHRRVMRDSAGRIFQERALLVPKDGQRQPEVWRLEISDPSSHQKYFCLVATHTCMAQPYAAPASTQVPASGPLPAGRGDLTRESLGTSLLNGVEAVGTRETTVLNAGTAGNTHPLTITLEFWYSPRLGINLIEKRSDPRHGTVTIGVTEISLTEPDAASFAAPPPGFTLAKPRASGGGN